jgi:tetratricopeptide (TPR) repeat protein
MFEWCEVFREAVQVKIHPSDLLLEEVLADSKDQHDALVRHLAACPRCRFRVAGLSNHARTKHGLSDEREVPTRSEPPRSQVSRSSFVGHGIDYTAIMEKSERKYLSRATDLQQERLEAPALVSELVQVAAEKRNLLVANSARFQTWGVFELLLESSWELRTSNRTRSEELARLAIQLSDYLDGSYYMTELIEDLRARAWTYVANLRRIAADLEGADTALALAYRHLVQGTHEPLERALFLDLKSSLRRAQRRFPEAIRFLQRAVALYLRQEDRHRAGKSLVGLSLVFSEAGETPKAITIVREALELIDPEQDERLLLSASHSLIWYLTHADRFIEAQGIYRKTLPLYRKYDDSQSGCRRLWIKGRIERGLGQDRSAEDLFVAARERCLADALPYEAALVSLELALLYAEQNRTAELKQLAAQVLPIFTSRQIHREALAALIFLEHAAEAERVSAEVVTALADVLKRAAVDPGLKFEAPV